MATIKHSIRKSRPKALFGADGALMAVAIGLQTANDTVNSIMQAKEARRQADNIRQSAIDQRKALEQQTQLQTAAMTRTNDNNKQLAEKTIESNKELFNEQTNALKDISTNLLLAQGQTNADERKNAAKLVVKRGGNIKRKLRNANTIPVSYNGNMPFAITDGGGVNLIGRTPEGYDLYEIIGNDHEHYHKTRGGKYKSGVGFKFPNGAVVEGEGNQSSSTGELVLVTPDDAMFISKHSIKGFNPTKAVLSGMHPLQAFNIQENKKGNRKLASYGTNIYNTQPDLKTDTVQSRSRALNAMTTEDYLNNGYNIIDGQLNQTDLSRTNVMRAKKGCSIKRAKAAGGLKWSNMNNLQKIGLIGMGLNSLGAIGNTVSNIIGSNRIIDANNYAAGILGEAWDTYSTKMAEAWRSRKGIDPSLISDGDYDYTPAVAAIRTARVNKNADLESLRRQEEAEINAAEKETISSAKRSILRGQINDKYNSLRNQVYQEQDNQEEQIKQANNEQLNQMAMYNAQLAQKANQSKLAAQLDIAKYNTDIENENIMGAADAEVQALLNKQGIAADTAKSNAASRSNMAMNISNTWNNALQGSFNTFTNLYGTLAGAEKDTVDYMEKNYPIFGKSNNKAPVSNSGSPVEEQKEKLTQIQNRIRKRIPLKTASIIKTPAPSVIFNPNYQPFYPFG